jgi:small subunit ribosomal protein S16
MALKIRLRQQGRTNRAFYRLVVTDSRSPRDGKYVELVGWYNPIEAEDDKRLSIKEDRIEYWLNTGAQLSEKAEHLIKHTAPHLVKAQVNKVIAHKAKAAEKRKLKSKAKA